MVWWPLWIMLFWTLVFLNIGIWLIMGLDAQNRCVLDGMDVENPWEDKASMWYEDVIDVNWAILNGVFWAPCWNYPHMERQIWDKFNYFVVKMTKISLESREKHDTCMYFGLVGLALLEVNVWNVSQIFPEKICSLSKSRLSKRLHERERILAWGIFNVKIWISFWLEIIRLHGRQTNIGVGGILMWQCEFPSDWKLQQAEQ